MNVLRLGTTIPVNVVGVGLHGILHGHTRVRILGPHLSSRTPRNRSPLPWFLPKRQNSRPGEHSIQGNEVRGMRMLRLLRLETYFSNSSVCGPTHHSFESHGNFPVLGFISAEGNQGPSHQPSEATGHRSRQATGLFRALKPLVF